MAKLSHDELVMLLQEERIDWLQFVMNGEQADEYLSFCSERGIDPSPETAEFFVDLCDMTAMGLQEIPQDYYV